MLNSLINFKPCVLKGQWKKELSALSKTEKVTFLLLILAVISLVTFDLSADFSNGQSVTHIAIDFFFGIGATICLLMVWRQMGKIRCGHIVKIMDAENNAFSALNEAARWKFEAEAIQKAIQTGISDEIERQLSAWSLTPSEKEIALLLLKGISIKVIATIRNTTERTVRHHTLAIYQKAGVTGRAELSAFFLEEFLDRQNPIGVITPATIKAVKN